MGYLDNTSITVDAILTKRGRELLARGDGSFNITQFALADDEIDYTLFNEDHPNGSQYAGEAIENMALIEALPDENNMMLHKLITLTFTGKSIKFGNFTCLSKITVEKLINEKATWNSFSGSLTKIESDLIEIPSIRGDRYYGPSKMSILSLIILSI